MFLKEAVIVFVVLFAQSRSQEYDFGAEITRQCLVPDPVGLLDCVENKVTLPYLKSWVDCTNSLGENVKTSTDIINYRCKSVWEGKGVIPEVFYIKDCVIEKIGLPPKNVSAIILGAYKECESSPSQPSQDSSRIKLAPIQQQQVVIQPPPTQQITQSIKTVPPNQLNTASQPAFTTASPLPQHQIKTAGPNYAQSFGAPQLPVQRQPFSRQYFVIYPRPPMPIQPQTARTSYASQGAMPIVSQQQVPVPSSSFNSQQQPSPVIVPTQQQVSYPSSSPQQTPQPYVSQQQISAGSYSPFQQLSQPVPSFPVYGAIPNGAYYYGFEIQHPQRIL